MISLRVVIGCWVWEMLTYDLTQGCYWMLGLGDANT